MDIFSHKPLEINRKNSFDRERLKVMVLDSRSLLSNVITLEGPTVTYCWPPEMPQDGDCAFYGTISDALKFGGEDWRGYDRLRFLIKTENDGARINNLNLGIRNEGSVKIPDEYFRDGAHVVELENHRVTECLWEFGDLPRDRITELSFGVRQNGRDTSIGENIHIEIQGVYLERTAKPLREKGWFCEPGEIAYPFTGYRIKGRKTAVTDREEDSFTIVNDDTGEAVFRGQCVKYDWQGQKLSLIDFSELQREGRFHIHMGDYRTPMFVINDEIFDDISHKLCNFLYAERCGYPVPNKHGICHMDIYGEHKGLKISFCGGWHDAGDQSQQMIHTAESVDALMRLAAEYRKTRTLGANDPLYLRLMEEACWGLEFVLRTRFRDGYRVTSAGTVRWTDGMIGNKDDIPARSHNHALENLMCSAICAQAALELEYYDKELAFRCRQVAIEDYRFGMERYKEAGMELPIMWEHTYNSSYSIYQAVIAIASVRVAREYIKGEATKAEAEKFEAEKKEEAEREEIKEEQTKDIDCRVSNALDNATNAIRELLACQETEKPELRGAFYRDKDKKELVHWNHQSREYLFVEALTEYEQLLKEIRRNSDIERVEHAELAESLRRGIELYASFVKRLMSYASPFQMIPAGIFSETEMQYRDTFNISHLLVEYEKEQQHYRAQLDNARALGGGLYLKQFPVWFSFRGNSAIMLAQARAAAILGNHLGDQELMGIAEEQLHWFLGKNPFRQSLIYGVGDRYASQYAVMCGEIMGEMPVGIETYQDEDIPYWPNANNATYKEVWTSSANRYMWVMAEILKGESRK